MPARRPLSYVITASFAGLIALAACAGGDRVEPVSIVPVPADPAASESGGGATTHEESGESFAQALPSISRAQRRAFAVGNSFFNDPWVVAPASAEGRDGLGPLFNATNCSGCHFHDGRGRPPEHVGDELESMLVRLSIPGPHGSPLPHPVYGDQFQDKAIPGVPAEGKVRITYSEIPGHYADGEPYSLRQPSVTLIDLGYGPLPADVQLSARVAPAVHGSGLLEAIPEADLVAYAAKPTADGFRGRARMVVEPRSGAAQIGRYGWKAGQPTIEAQSAGAFAGDIGITSSIHRQDNSTPSQTAARNAPNGGDPELSEHKLARVVEYERMLAVPARRKVGDPAIARGEALFSALRCDACHVSTWKTGVVPDLPALSGQTIHPYTDLLLHDMGEGIADHRPEGDAPDGATGTEWKTPPLWGIGLIKAVNHHELLLHDGRARGIAEAILWHGGDAEASRERFRKLPREQRADLLEFLNSL